MTDAELLARLLARLRKDDTDFWHCEAADRIKALIAENAKLHDHIEGVAKDTHKIMVGYEAKLAKAVEALEQIAQPKVGPDFDWTEDEANKWRAVWYRKYQDIALATLAEIKAT